MPFIPVAYTWKIAVTGFMAGKPWVNVYHLFTSLGLTQAYADMVENEIEGAYSVSGLLAYESTLWSATNVQVTDLTSSSSPQFNSVIDDVVGTDNGEVLPTQVNGMLDWRTAARGRSFRGRTFLNGFTEAGSAGASPTAGCLAAMQAFGNAMINNFTASFAAGSGLEIVSLYSGKMANPNAGGNRRTVPMPRAAGVTSLITTVSAEEVWKTQRRRAIAG